MFEMSQVIGEGAGALEHLSHAAWGETRDTDDPYICFVSAPGQEQQVFDGVMKLLEIKLPSSGLEVLGPFTK